MFVVHSSNRTERLLDQLLHVLETEPLRQPLRAEQILIQSPGMATWLKLRIAERLQVAANLAFPLPAVFFWNLFSQVMPTLAERSPFDREILRWRLMRLLPTCLDDPLYAPLNRYLTADRDSLLQDQISRKVAELLERYLIYRPDWVRAWEAEQPVAELEGNAHAAWQADLWRRLCADEPEPWHRLNVQQAFVDQLQAGAIEPGRLPQRVFVFGISALPPQHLDLMMTLAQHLDVHLMMLNPCKYYWGDVAGERLQQRLIDRLKPGRAVPIEAGAVDYYLEGCPLLASWGKVGRDYLAQIYAYNEVQENPDDLFMAPRSRGLLGRVQRDLLYLRQAAGEAVTVERLQSSRHKQMIQPDDRSLRVACAHSPLREVEALYDYLLGWFNRRRGLKPRDVVVMVPDINRFAPFIQAVFGSAPPARYIPFAIADQALQAEHPLVTALDSLLSLPRSRLGRSELLDILEVPAVMRRFQLQEEDLPTIRRWLEEAGIRWGLDAEHRAQSVPDLPPHSDFNTWSRGLERLLLGYAVGEIDELLGDEAPAAGIEGGDARLVGALCEFLAQVRRTLALSHQCRPLSQWIRVAQDLLQGFFWFDGSEENHLRAQLVQALDDVQRQATLSRFAEPVSLSVFRGAWLGELEQQDNSARFLAGKVNFCTLIPMRSIPFRVVCVLGLNDGDYPRILPRPSFDLMAVSPRRADRSRRDDDRYLFLETLISARDAVYLSYEGRDARDNKARVPSVLVSELVEYCEHNFCLAGDEDLPSAQSAERLRQWLVTEHRLQPFHAHYYHAPDDARDRPSTASGAPLFTYLDDWLPLFQARQDRPVTDLAGLSSAVPGLAPPVELERVLELSALQAFFDNPCRAFLQERLGVRYGKPQEQRPDVEPFELDGRQRYQLRCARLASLARDEPESRFRQRWQASGELPPGAQGERLVAREAAKAQVLFQRYQALAENPLADQELDCRVGELQVQHWFRDCFAVGRVQMIPAQCQGKQLFRAWLAHLFYNLLPGPSTDEPTRTSWLLGLAGEEPVLYRFQPLSPVVARQYVETLVHAYRRGLSHPLPFLPGTAWAWAEAGEDKRARKAAEVFRGNPFQGLAGEGEDLYVRRLFPTWEALAEGLGAWAEVLVAPALHALVKEAF